VTATGTPVPPTRAGWLSAGKELLTGALAHTDGMRGPLRFPHASIAGYPKRTGAVMCSDRVRDAYTESYARTLFLAAGLVHADPQLVVRGRGVAEYFREFLVRGATEWGTGATFGRPEDATRAGQCLVEAAFITMSLGVARDELWAPLTDPERGAVVDYLSALKDAKPYPNNWRWFTVLVNTFLKRAGYPHNEPLTRWCLEGLKADYVDAGWYHDNGSLDFYAGFIQQTLPLFWADWDGATHAALRDEVLKRHNAFLGTYPHVFSRDGRMPRWGRSLTYRFASAAPLPLAFTRPDTPRIDPGFARKMATGTLNQFLGRPGVVKDGILSLGFYGEDPRVVDPYSCTGSPMFACQTFLALGLPADSPFWTAPLSDGFWADPPKKFTLGTTGLKVEHDPATGRTKLFAPPGTHKGDPRYDAPFFETD